MSNPKIDTPFLRSLGVHGVELNLKRVVASVYGDRGVDRRTEAQKAREPGFYWVKFKGDWYVDQWTGSEWLTHGQEETWREDVGEIGPRIEPPEDVG